MDSSIRKTKRIIFLNNNGLNRKVVTYLLFPLFAFFFIGVVLFKTSSLHEILFFLCAMIMFGFTGLPLGLMLFGKDLRKHPESLIFGFVLGIIFSSLITSYAVALVQWNKYIIICSLLVFTFGYWIILSRYAGLEYKEIESVDNWDRRDYLIIVILLLVTSFIFTLPLINIGRVTQRGMAFTSLVGNDFIAHMNHTASLSNAIPPQYFHFYGDLLRYYYLSFVLPAFVYSLSGQKFNLMSIMIMTQITYSFMFIGSLMALLRLFIKNKVGLLLTIIIALYANSYKDIFVMISILMQKTKGSGLSQFLDGKGLLNFSFLSHGFVRSFMFEGQILLGLCLMLWCIYLIYQGEKFKGRKSIAILFSLPIFSGLSMGVEAIIGVLITGVVGSFILKEIWNETKKEKDYFKGVLKVAICICIFFLTFGMLFGLKMFSFQHGGGAVILRLNKLIVETLPIYLFLDYGPVLIFGVCGLLFTIKKGKTGKYYLVLILIIMAFFIMLFTDIAGVTPYHNMVVKAGKSVLIGLVIYMCIFIDWFLKYKNNRKLLTLVLGIIVISLPTTIIDVWELSNVKNSENTVYVSREDYEAAMWIKNNTSKESVIQSFSDKSAIAIVTFGERGMILGWNLAYQVLHDDVKGVDKRKADIERLFKDESIRETTDVIRRYGIKYIYIGKIDREKMTDENRLKFEGNNNLFEKVYSNGGVNIFKVKIV